MKLDLESINYINVFEKITGAKIKDCIVENGRLMFIVDNGNISRAIGKNGSNVNKVKSMIKKEIVIVCFDDDATKFTNNLLYPLKVEDIKLEGNIINISVPDNYTKGKIFGRNKENLKRILTIVKRYFNVVEIRVN